ncbi:hypothetical protein NDU88_004115 [Pleurodeles waltl]|uniref:Uncharacterized protein n=1 Tax=Pleurodeles waltl TaxID=8319 RepID=A0AAV7T8N8_PLEWA|nr:hypothetical protein NDU88_004115 [Pleurodeles waltl]
MIYFWVLQRWVLQRWKAGMQPRSLETHAVSEKCALSSLVRKPLLPHFNPIQVGEARYTKLLYEEESRVESGSSDLGEERGLGQQGTASPTTRLPRHLTLALQRPLRALRAPAERAERAGA